SVGHAGPVTDLLLAELGANAHVEVYACGPPGMLEAVRAICVERDVPAQLAMESAWRAATAPASAAWSRPRPATCACASTDRYWGGRRYALPHPRRAGHQRVGHVRRDRRPARVRRCAAGALPVRRLRHQDRHRRAAPGQPAAAPVRAAGRAY